LNYQQKTSSLKQLERELQPVSIERKSQQIPRISGNHHQPTFLCHRYYIKARLLIQLSPESNACQDPVILCLEDCILHSRIGNNPRSYKDRGQGNLVTKSA
jgi:hypothetical protein